MLIRHKTGNEISSHPYRFGRVISGDPEYDLRMRKNARDLLDISFRKSLQQAKPDDYVKWLKGYIRSGKRPTHYYDYPMSRQNFYIATADIEVPPLYGSESVNIIIPPGIKATYKDGLGHNNVFLMDGFQIGRGGFFVPVFEDLDFLSTPDEPDPEVDIADAFNVMLKKLFPPPGEKPTEHPDSNLTDEEIVGIIDEFRKKALEKEREFWRYMDDKILT